MDFGSYAYKDTLRETQRRQVNQDKASSGEDIIARPRLAKKELKRAWSEKFDQRNERERRREKKRAVGADDADRARGAIW